MKRKIAAALVGVGGAVGSVVPALANEPAGGTANQAVVGAMTTVAGDMTATATAILPIALGVVGLILVVRYGLKTFKSAAK